MDYVLVVYNKKGEEVYRKEYPSVSGNFMMEIYQDYAYKGGKGGYADFFQVGYEDYFEENGKNA